MARCECGATDCAFCRFDAEGGAATIVTADGRRFVVGWDQGEDHAAAVLAEVSPAGTMTVLAERHRKV